MGLAAAGVGVAVGLTLWQAQQTPPEDAVRGGTGALSLTAEARGDSLYAVWPRVTGAAQYRLRLFTSDGVILLEREVADTALVLPASALPAGSELAQTLAQVQAENELREPLARSELEAITSGPHQ